MKDFWKKEDDRRTEVVVFSLFQSQHHPKHRYRGAFAVPGSEQGQEKLLRKYLTEESKLLGEQVRAQGQIC